MDKENSLYKITFHSQEKTFEIFAQKISVSELSGFLTAEELISSERREANSRIGWSERRAVNNLSGSVKRSYIPIGSIIRIDEMENNMPQQLSGFEEDEIPQIFEAEG